jgi:5-formyltetrahydrofolate cyclo-ligase
VRTDPDGIVAAKAAVRAEGRARRRAMSPEQRAAASVAITDGVLGLSEVVSAGAVHVYLSTPSEVDTWGVVSSLLLDGVRVIVPVMVDRRMIASELAMEDLDAMGADRMGLPVPPELRPVPDGWWDVVLAPLVAFDHACRRVGQGGGYYDALLAARPRPSVGLAFACQQVPEVPIEPHDRALDAVVTEIGLIRR